MAMFAIPINSQDINPAIAAHVTTAPQSAAPPNNISGAAGATPLDMISEEATVDCWPEPSAEGVVCAFSC